MAKIGIYEVNANEIDAAPLPTAAVKGTKTFSVAAPAIATATLLLAANANRKKVILANNAAGSIFLGKDNTVTIANGIPLAAGASLTDDTTTDAWWGIGAAAGDMRILEVA